MPKRLAALLLAIVMVFGLFVPKSIIYADEFDDYAAYFLDGSFEAAEPQEEIYSPEFIEIQEEAKDYAIVTDEEFHPVEPEVTEEKTKENLEINQSSGPKRAPALLGDNANSVPDDSGNSFSYTADNLTLTCYKIGTNLSVEIVSASGDVVIPETITGSSGTVYTVTSIKATKSYNSSASGHNGNYALNNSMANAITSLKVPETVVAIEGNLFDWQYETSSRIGWLISGDSYDYYGYNLYVSVPDSSRVISVIPKFIKNGYENGAYYAGKCLVRVNPYYVGDLKVKEGTKCILASAFEDCSSIKNVTLPSSVEYIGVRAFANSSITSINLPSGLSVRSDQLRGSHSYDSVIQMQAFYGCSDLKAVDIQADIYNVGYMGFMKCPKLKDFDMTKVEVINTLSFAGTFAKGYDLDLSNTCLCEPKNPWTFIGAGMSSVKFGDKSFQYIPYETFCNCRNLEKIEWTDYQTATGCEAFSTCKNLKDDVLGQDDCNLMNLGHHSFERCGFTEITIPESVLYMDGGVFSKNPQLDTLNWRAKDFFDNTKLMPSDHISDYRQSTGMLFAILDDSMNGACNPGYTNNKEYYDNYKESDTYTTIKTLNLYSAIDVAKENKRSSNNFFSMQPALETVNVKTPWKNINSESETSGAFQMCVNLKEFNLDYPEALESVGMNCFSMCGFDEITLYGHVGYGPQTYGWNNKLKKVTITEDMDSLPWNPVYQSMFINSINLETVNVEGSLKHIPMAAFRSNTNLREFTLAHPEALESVGQSAFMNCGFEDVVLLKGVHYDLGAFQNNTKLKRIVVEDGVTEIPVLAFENAYALKEVAIPDSVTTIRQGAFKGAGNDVVFYIPETVTLIEDEAFGTTGSGERKSSQVVIMGDPYIETEHSGYDGKIKHTYTFDNHDVYRIWTNQGDNFKAYTGSEKVDFIPEEILPLPDTLIVTSTEKEIFIGEEPNKDNVTVTVNGKKLSKNQYDLEYDYEKSDRETGERYVKVIIKDGTGDYHLTNINVSSSNFSGSPVSGNAYNVVSKEDAEYGFYVQAKLADYSITSGDSSAWERGTDKGLEFEAERSEDKNLTFERFDKLRVDGKRIKEDNYDKEKVDGGGIKITLHTDFLKTLELGEHTLSVIQSDGQADASFNVEKEKENPKPDDPVDPKPDDPDVPVDPDPSDPGSDDPITPGPEDSVDPEGNPFTPMDVTPEGEEKKDDESGKEGGTKPSEEGGNTEKQEGQESNVPAEPGRQSGQGEQGGGNDQRKDESSTPGENESASDKPKDQEKSDDEGQKEDPEQHEIVDPNTPLGPDTSEKKGIPTWVYPCAAVGLGLIIFFIILFKRRKDDEEEEENK